MSSIARDDKTSPSFFPLASVAQDGWSTENEATATCFCGAVQLSFKHHINNPNQPTQGPGLVDRFLCHCADCRKISSSMFCSNFSVADSHLRHIRGKETLKIFSQSRTIATGNDMANHFCGTCGTLMYRVSSGLPGMSILRLGTVDDFRLVETKLKPQVEQFIDTRASWVKPIEGVLQLDRMHTDEDIESLL
ncbi:hypothetical protein CORC01_12997 [Colletotrichum orchidophilum]|uniref:CENP-V/GFA domain-containing protein n=1 Tax=Colletotrichum orchidophilum TaxID=1209926 RepID=A0A1G4ARH0_9PEZI|nr:uncharacterized protein CORC01_12997 [Colletotrichum orchidophilum]OHE91706.1 hypothetical protein CORC01_12997 [Colletotrichum orchidophilum]